MNKTSNIHLRISESEKAEWEKAAADQNMGISEWLRMLARIAIAQNK